MSYATVAQLRAYLNQIKVEQPSDTLLGSILDRATDLVRQVLRAWLADPLFDYAAWGAPSTKIVRGYATYRLPLPPHQSGTVTLVEYQSGSSPSAYTALEAAQWEADGAGGLYRASGWGGGIGGDYPRYRVTAIWGYGETVPSAIEEVTLEVAVNIWRSRDKGGFSELVGVEGSGAVRVVAGLNSQQRMAIESIATQLFQVHV